jgi:hypothetical protein
MALHPSSVLKLVLPRWIRVSRTAFAHWIVGMAMGALVAVLLVALSIAFPSLHHYSRDLGLAMSVSWERAASINRGGVDLRSGDNLRRGDSFGYAFADLDPIATQSFAAVGQPYERACRDSLPVGVAVADCDPRNAINRHLLARTVVKIRASGARLVVVDVLLEGSLPGTNEAGTEALRQALSAPGAPVIYSMPIAGVLPPAKGGLGVALPAAGEIAPMQVPHVRRAVPYPEPGQPLRRYPRCFVEHGTDRPLPSLPFAAAQALEFVPDTRDACLPAEPAPRIVFTLPTVAGGTDDATQTAGMADVYRSVLTYCEVQQMWDSNDACSLETAYKDRIVVIGASNPMRRDRHFTPLGDMAGAEVVVNAIRSFDLYRSAADQSVWKRLAGKLAVLVSVGLLAWFPFFIFAAWREQRQPRGRLLGLAWLRESVLRCLAFGLTALAAIALSILLSVVNSETPDIDVLLPVAAVSMEVVIDVAADLKLTIQNWLHKKLGFDTHASGDAA